MDDFQYDYFLTYKFDKLTELENLQLYLEGTAGVTNNSFESGKNKYA